MSTRVWRSVNASLPWFTFWIILSTHEIQEQCYCHLCKLKDSNPKRPESSSDVLHLKFQAGLWSQCSTTKMSFPNQESKYDIYHEKEFLPRLCVVAFYQTSTHTFIWALDGSNHSRTIWYCGQYCHDMKKCFWTLKIRWTKASLRTW